VIHAASMQLGGKTSADSLRIPGDSLRIANERGLKTIAFRPWAPHRGISLKDCAEIMHS